MNEIPLMTHPLAVHREQPSPRDILLDDKHALMTEKTCARLERYDTSTPSGVYAGKMWRRMNWLCWFVDVDADNCRVMSREILVVH